jgi:hypothetical protein
MTKFVRISTGTDNGKQNYSKRDEEKYMGGGRRGDKKDQEKLEDQK